MYNEMEEHPVYVTSEAETRAAIARLQKEIEERRVMIERLQNRLTTGSLGTVAPTSG